MALSNVLTSAVGKTLQPTTSRCGCVNPELPELRARVGRLAQWFVHPVVRAASVDGIQ